LLGEVEMKLDDLVKYGTVDFFKAGFQVRSTKRKVDLLSRSGSKVGSLSLLLSIAWRG
jgi:hypothetical protein